MYCLPVDCKGEKEIVALKLDTCVRRYKCGLHLSALLVQGESRYLGRANIHPAYAKESQSFGKD